jgi:hypothetical protein
VDEADSVYQAKKWECKEAIKLNSAACFLKIGQYRECLGACNDILKVIPSFRASKIVLKKDPVLVQFKQHGYELQTVPVREPFTMRPILITNCGHCRKNQIT